MDGRVGTGRREGARARRGPRPIARQATARRAGTLLALVALVLLTGCASTGRRDAGSYFEARGADLMDVFGLRIAAGAGLGVYVRASEYAQLGFMIRGPVPEGVGTPEIDPRGVPVFMFGTIGRYGGAWFDEHDEIMLPGYSTREDPPTGIRREVIAGTVSLDGTGDSWRGAFGVGAHLLLIGLEAELRPLEALDFIAGLFGYDPSSDDVPVGALDDDA